MQEAKRSVVFSAMMGGFMLVIVGAILITVALFTAAQQSAASAPQTTSTAAFEWHYASGVDVSIEQIRNRQNATLPPGVTPYSGVHEADEDPESWRYTPTNRSQNPANPK